MRKNSRKIKLYDSSYFVTFREEFMSGDYLIAIKPEQRGNFARVPRLPGGVTILRNGRFVSEPVTLPDPIEDVLTDGLRCGPESWIRLRDASFALRLWVKYWLRDKDTGAEAELTLFEVEPEFVQKILTAIENEKHKTRHKQT